MRGDAPTLGAVRAPAAPGLTGAQWRTIVLASLGGALEFYDFIIYGIFVPSIAAAFFPASDPLVGLVLSFSVFAGGYLARPFGGLLLGALGDRFGRRGVFLFSLGAISASTVAMGLLPGYASWGVGATVLMVALRLVQGLCLGGELPCSIVYAVETAPARGGFACGVLFFCVNSGVSLAALVSLAVNTLMPPEAAAATGWRVAFVFGGLTGLASLAIRRRLHESPEFAALRGVAARTPLRELFGAYPMPVLIGIGTSAATSAFNGMMFVYLPAYLVRVLHHAPAEAAWAQNAGLATTSVGLLAVSWLGDRMPRRHLLALGAGLLAALSYPFFAALAAGSLGIVPLFVLAGAVAALINGTFAMVLADLFPTRVRFSGVAVSYNVSQTLFGGTVPLVAAALVAGTGSPLSPALVMVVCAAVAFAATFGLKRHGGRVGAAEPASPAPHPSVA
ncbi:MFS transporter [Lichenibacterium ramalinae]|uniref:MFS transporter n=2 Tax=Lichenibacterium ramalinae TaxID=2316527 RepID=A0A4Q2RM92_9HYPH|nr:MFS transporter [Lichenibacterium ramalinae]